MTDLPPIGAMSQEPSRGIAARGSHHPERPSPSLHTVATIQNTMATIPHTMACDRAYHGHHPFGSLLRSYAAEGVARARTLPRHRFFFTFRFRTGRLRKIACWIWEK